MNKISITAIILSGILMAGCNTFRNSGKTAVRQPSAESSMKFDSSRPLPPAELEGEWAVVSVGGKNVAVNGDDYPNISFVIDKDMPGALTVIGFNGCNYINGSYFVDGTTLSKGGEFISTMKACADAPYETEINRALDAAVSYGINRSAAGCTMALTNSAGTTVMTLRKHDIAFLNGAWKVDKINGSPVPASADVQIVIDLDQKSIHGNTGCNVLNGGLILTLDKENGIEFKDLATTRMACPDLATEQAFLLALENVVSAARDGSDNNAVLKDADGNAVIALSRIDLKQ